MTSLFDSIKERYRSVASSAHPNEEFRAAYRQLWMSAGLCTLTQLLFLCSLGYCLYTFGIVMSEFGLIEMHLQAWNVLRKPELIDGSTLYAVRYVLLGASTMLMSYFLSGYLGGELERQAARLLDIPIR